MNIPKAQKLSYNSVINEFGQGSIVQNSAEAASMSSVDRRAANSQYTIQQTTSNNSLFQSNVISP
jgi:hypothetical protein